jgi:hypothetical protein
MIDSIFVVDLYYRMKVGDYNPPLYFNLKMEVEDYNPPLYFIYIFDLF